MCKFCSISNPLLPHLSEHLHMAPKQIIGVFLKTNLSYPQFTSTTYVSQSTRIKRNNVFFKEKKKNNKKQKSEIS